VKSKRDTATDESRRESDDAFRRTVKRMLSTPPRKQVELKKGAAPKRDPRSSRKGSKD